MKITAITYLLTVLLCAVTFGCVKEVDHNPNESEQQSVDLLDQYELIGEWEIQSRLINNISGMPALCCEYVAFSVDQNEIDNIGIFRYTGNGESVAGTFEVIDFESMKILINGNLHPYSFAVNGNYLSLAYIENGDSISEIWVKH